jgi:hypothetical protein
MSVELIVHAGVDSAFIAWRAPFIDQCRGFALKRKVKRVAGSAASPNTTTGPDADGFVEEIVASWVGFANGPKVAPGTRKPTTEWPIQKYLWSDFMVNPGDVVAYSVVPMTGLPSALQEGEGSAWSAAVEIGAVTEGHAACFFNRGIVASQWLARQLPKEHPTTELVKIIANFLGGPVREELISLLTDTNAANGHVYAALFELDDPELIPLLEKFGNGRTSSSVTAASSRRATTKMQRQGRSSTPAMSETA